LEKVRVLVADDHEFIRNCIVKLIARECLVVASVANGREVIDSFDELHPDIVVLDIAMPEMNGIEAVNELRRKGRRPKILFVSNSCDQALVEAARDCGASGYIAKPHAAEELIPALRAIADGGTHFSQTIGGSRQPRKNSGNTP